MSATHDPQGPRHRRIRAANTLLADAARLHRFEDDTPVPFRCECDDDDCQEYALLTLPQFADCSETVAFTTPGHRLENALTLSETEGYRLYATGARGPS